MHKLLRLIRRDFRNIFHSRSILITLIAFCMVPAFYALLNIRASWDPYAQSNTRRLPIAVVNSDEGSTINGKTLNVGNQVVKELKQNHQIHWVIINDWQANNGLDQGKYYALIEIPNDFSSRLSSLTTNEPQRPNIIYKSNEKLNPAATKISSQAKDNLTQQIRSSFTKIAGKEALKQMNRVGLKLDTKKSKILQIRTSLLDAVKTINKTKAYLKRTNRDSKDVQNYLTDVRQNIPKVTSQIKNLRAIIQHGRALNLDTRQTIDSAKRDLSSGLDDLHSQNSRFQSSLDALTSNLNNTGNISSGQVNVSQLKTINQTLLSQINSNLRVLDVINNFLPNNRTTTLIKTLAASKDKIHHQQQLINRLGKILNQQSHATQQTKSIAKQLTKLNDQLTDRIESASSSFNNTTTAALDRLSDTIDTQLNGNDTVIQSLNALVPELKALNTAGSTVSKLSINRVNRISQRLNQIQSTLNALNQQASFLNKKNLNQLIEILSKKPETANFLSSPISLKTEELYNLGLFGYGVTPFYSVLSIWIGILLLAVILRWRYRLSPGSRLQPNEFQHYFGKFTLFLSGSLLQTTITLFGQIVFLGIRPASLFAMMLMAYATTLFFTFILFTFVFLFGNVGKVIDVLLMIIQIFGTGGLYPLETISHQLAILAPFLPFTYAIQGYREAIAGPDWSILGMDLLFLVGFAAAVLLFTPLKLLLEKPIKLLESGMKKSGL